MNERIKELALQSGAVPLAGHGGLIISNLNVEKFAELIVGECMDIIRQEWFKENNSEVDRQDTRSVAIHVGKKLGIDASLNAVTKHFGVEYE